MYATSALLAAGFGVGSERSTRIFNMVHHILSVDVDTEVARRQVGATISARPYERRDHSSLTLA
jgi:hypothetical protein